MKKAVILVLCLLMLCGCNKQEQPNKTELETHTYTTEQQNTSIQNITIYLFNENTAKLESKIVPVTIYPDQTRAEAALAYLLSTPSFAFTLNSYKVPDYTMTVSGGIARVHINNAYTDNNQFKSMALHFSVVNTLCSIDGINYASVYAGNSELGQNTYIGASRFLEKDLEEHNIEIYGIDNNLQTQNTATQKSMLLYYSDKSEKYVVPEHNSLYANISNVKATVNTIIGKLSTQPVNTANLMPSLSPSLLANTATLKDGILNIDLNKNPWNSAEKKEVAYASLFNTLTGVYPSVTNVNLTVNGAPDTDYPSINADTFSDSVGNVITLYMTKPNMDSLYPVSRYISAKSNTSISHILEALIDGPTGYDSPGLVSPISGELTSKNIVSTKVVNDLAIVNFDISFYDTVKTLDKTQESIIVYAIVNSLTEREQINRVQFLINGQGFNTINNHINYASPIISNPGISLK